MARWISGLTLAVAVIELVLYVPATTCRWIVVVLSALGAREYFRMAGLEFVTRVAGSCFAVIGTATAVWRPDTLLPTGFLGVALFVAALAGMGKRGKAPDERVRGFALSFLGMVYISFGFGGVGRLFSGPDYRVWVFLALAATFMGDTAAYLAGRMFGKHRIVPHISPSKTAEGFAGALLGGIVGAWTVKLGFAADWSATQTVVFGAVIAVCGAFGDLLESLLKRGFGVKDSGALIPGHGGLLDRMDGLMFSAPIVVYFLRGTA